jgi:hypothetical protein
MLRYRWVLGLLLVFVLVVFVLVLQIYSETNGKTTCVSADPSKTKICVAYPEKLQFVDAKPSVYSISVWLEPDGSSANQQVLTATVSVPGPYAYLLRSANDNPLLTIEDLLTKNKKTRLDYLLVTNSGIEEDENSLELKVSVAALDGNKPLIEPLSMKIPVENFWEKLWQLALVSLSWIIPIGLAVWVFIQESERQRNEWVSREFTTLQITSSVEMLLLIGRLLEKRKVVHNRWKWLEDPPWLDRLNDLSTKIEPLYLFQAVGELVANEPASYQTNLRKVIDFLQLEYERQCRGSSAEEWLMHWQIESSKISPHCSLYKLMNGSQVDSTSLVATIDGINSGKYSEPLAPLLAHVLQQHVDRFEKGNEKDKIAQMFMGWDSNGRRRIAVKLSPSVLEKFSELQLHAKPSLEDDLLSTVELPVFEDRVALAWLRKAGFHRNPFSPYLKNVQNWPESISLGDPDPFCVYVAADASECFAVALSYLAQAYKKFYFPVWCVKDMNVQTEILSELILNALAASWVKFLALYPEEIFRVINDCSDEPRMEQRLQLAEILRLSYGTSQDIRVALNTAFQQTYDAASKSPHDVHTQLHLTIESLCENLSKKRLSPQVFTYDVFKQWFSLRPGSTSGSLIMLIDPSGCIKTNDKQLVALVKLLQRSRVSVVLLTCDEFLTNDALPTKIVKFKWEPSELERILGHRLADSSSNNQQNLDSFVSTPVQTTYHEDLCAAAEGSLGKLLQLGNQIIQLHVTERPNSTEFEADILERVLGSGHV